MLETGLKLESGTRFKYYIALITTTHDGRKRISRGAKTSTRREFGSKSIVSKSQSTVRYTEGRQDGWMTIYKETSA